MVCTYESKLCWTCRQIWFIEPVAGRAYYNALAKVLQADAVIERSSTGITRGFPFLYWMKEVTYSGKAIQLKVQ